MPWTYTLGAQRTHNQIDSDANFFQIVRWSENHTKGLKDKYERLIDFLTQISKPSYFNLLDLADVLMNHYFPFCFLVWQAGCALTTTNPSMQYVRHFKLRHWLAAGTPEQR